MRTAVTKNKWIVLEVWQEWHWTCQMQSCGVLRSSVRKSFGSKLRDHNLTFDVFNVVTSKHVKQVRAVEKRRLSFFLFFFLLQPESDVPTKSVKCRCVTGSNLFQTSVKRVVAKTQHVLAANHLSLPGGFFSSDAWDDCKPRRPPRFPPGSRSVWEDPSCKCKTRSPSLSRQSISAEKHGGRWIGTLWLSQAHPQGATVPTNVHTCQTLTTVYTAKTGSGNNCMQTNFNTCLIPDWSVQSAQQKHKQTKLNQ